MLSSVARRRRVLLIAGAAGLVLVLALATAASAHDVTGITATCSTVTVHVTDFPKVGVDVHIVVQVGTQPEIVEDVVVSSATSDVEIDISAATAGLAGATAPVDVDATWTNFGPQHVHKTTSVTCGTATTTSTTHATSTTRSTSTTRATTTTRSTSTTIAQQTTTSTTVPPVVGHQIFQVEFRRCHVLHVGYEHFPSGTVVHYSVKQSDKHFAGGQFVTQPGKGYHFTSMQLGKRFALDPRKADAHFFWFMRGMPYRYFVRRATGC